MHGTAKRLAIVGGLWVALGLASASAVTAGEPDREIQLIYLGASACGQCKQPEMREAWAKAREIFAERARREGAAFVTIGIAIDQDVGRGLEFLSDKGPFDEIVVGQGWHNLAVVEYVWKHPPGPDDLPNVALPQLIVAERDLRYEGKNFVPAEPRILRYMIGTLIPQWVDKGAPLRR